MRTKATVTRIINKLVWEYSNVGAKDYHDHCNQYFQDDGKDGITAEEKGAELAKGISLIARGLRTVNELLDLNQ